MTSSIATASKSRSPGAGRKNDCAYVEQKNWSVVRRAVGFWRYDSPVQLDLPNALYARLLVYVHFVQPVMRIREDSPRNQFQEHP